MAVAPVPPPSAPLPPLPPQPPSSDLGNAPPGSYPEADAIQKKIAEEREKPGGGDPAVIKDLLKQLDDYFDNYNK